MSRPETDYFLSLVERLQQLQADGAAARRFLEEAALEHPGDARILLLLAAERVHASDIDGAEGAYLAALQVAPQFHIARFQLGLLQLTAARPTAALVTWAPLQALDEGDPLRIFSTGLACLARDEFAEARRLLELGIARNKDNPPLNRDMRLVLDRIAQLAPGGTPGDPDAEAPATDAASSAHFLVSTYRKSS